MWSRVCKNRQTIKSKSERYNPILEVLVLYKQTVPWLTIPYDTKSLAGHFSRIAEIG